MTNSVPNRIGTTVASWTVMLLALITGGCGTPTIAADAVNYRRGAELLDRIDTSFATRDAAAPGLLVGQLDSADPTWRPRGAASCSAAAVHLAALVEAARVDHSRIAAMQKFIAACDAYWLRDDPAGGYNATLPRPGESNRAYADNAAMCIALLDAYDLTHDQTHLDRAQKTLRFVLAGTDSRLRGAGGIFRSQWEREVKTATATSLAIIACLRMDRAMKTSEYRPTAILFYRWINQNLQDTDGLYFDHIGADGGVDRTKSSRNTGLMIQATCLLYGATRDQGFIDEAERIAKTAQAFWSDGATGGIHDIGSSAHELAEAFVDLSAHDSDPRWRDVAARCAEFLARNHADRNGWHPSKWDASTPPQSVVPIVRVVDQSCVANVFLRLARPAPVSPP